MWRAIARTFPQNGPITRELQVKDRPSKLLDPETATEGPLKSSRHKTATTLVPKVDKTMKAQPKHILAAHQATHPARLDKATARSRDLNFLSCAIGQTTLFDFTR